MNRKIPDSVRHNSDTNVRLTVRFLEQALREAKRGNVDRMCTHLRVAASFEQDIQTDLRFGPLEVVG